MAAETIPQRVVKQMSKTQVQRKSATNTVVVEV